MHRFSIFFAGVLLASWVGSSVWAQAQPAPTTPQQYVPPPHTERAMVFPLSTPEWNALNVSGITILNNFGQSAEIAATPAAITGLRNQGITLHELPGPNTTYFRRWDLDPTQYPIDMSNHAQINAFPNESHPLVVATNGVWQASWTGQLQAQGAQVIGHMPPYGAVVHLPINNLSAVENLPFVNAVMYLDPVERLAPRLGTSNWNDVTTMEILIYPGFSGTRILTEFANAGIPATSTTIYGRELITVDMDVYLAYYVAWYPEVEWIDDYDPGETYNDQMRVLVQTDSFYFGANQAFYNPLYAIGVNGSTETISISDSGIRPTHETLLAPGKVALEYVPTGSLGTLGDEFGHGMAVACSALGDRIGQTSFGYHTPNNFDGLAVDAKLIMQDIGYSNSSSDEDAVALPDDWITEVLLRAYNEGSRIQNSSWGHGNSNINFMGGTYSFRSQLIDQFCNDPQYYDSVQIFAVGNHGGDHMTSPPNITYQPRSLSDEAHAKNAISVGGHRNGYDRNIMYSYSSRGPCNDGQGHGRVKPDLVSVGSTLDTADEFADNAYWVWFGTSHAAPIVSGATALIRDWYNKGNYNGPAIFGEMSSALIKAMLINSTRYQGHTSAFLGNAAEGLPTDGYPNYDQGYGRPVLDSVLDPNGYRQVQLIQDLTTDVETGDRWTRTINLQNTWSQAPCNSLRVTLAWTDEAMALSSGKALVNDLDLQVRFNGQKYIGNPRHLQDGRFDSVNNIEDLLIPLDPDVASDLPYNFSIQVDVLGTSVFSTIAQPFAVVVTYGACRGTIPCVAPPPCYPGPGDVVPTPNPPRNPCEQGYSTGEYTGGGGGPYPYCEPPLPPYQPKEISDAEPQQP